MIKVVHFIHGLNTGGAETLVKDYATNFDKKIFNVVILCMDHEKESPYEKELDKLGINTIYVQDMLPFKKQTNAFKKVANRVFKYVIVKRIIRSENPEILHIHLHLNRLVKYARPKRKTKIYLTVHNEPRVLWEKDIRWRQREFRAVEWLVKNRGMRFIVLHDNMRKEINKLFSVSNTVVLNNGIDLEKFREKRNKKQIRNKFNIPDCSFIVGHVGRFSEQKNHEFLVDTFLDIKGSNKKAFLLLVGDGVNKKKIIKELDNAKMENDYLVLSNRDDVPELMSMMDVFVFPSLFEGLGTVLIEAQEAGLPCFVSDKVPEHAMISNLVTRLSLEDGAKRWADAIINYKKPEKVLINDKDWDIKKVTKQLEQIYLGALAERNDGKK